MRFDPESIHINEPELFDCEGSFADIDCAGVASLVVLVDLPGTGMTVGVGRYCRPCADEVARRLVEGD